ncbi:MAG: radical SAM protein [Thermoplasmata archaeon]|nr:MAG: radical SAM protein [Thermoplasmata archaeon]
MTNNNPAAHSCIHPDTEELTRYFEQNKVYTVQIESNLACSQGCLYCYASSDTSQNRELPDEVIKSVLDSADRMGIRAVDWLGGDPLVREGWDRLMEYAEERGLKNNIWTSGLPLRDMDAAKKAVELSVSGFISVHLDTLDENLYRKLHTGPADNIKAILQGVDNVLTLGKSPECVFNCITFTRDLAGEDVRRTMSYFFEEKGVRTCLTQMCGVGLAQKHPEWIPALEDIREAVMARDEINYPAADISMSTMDANKYYCGGAICVTVDGDVTPCSVIRKGYGNVLSEPFETIVERNRESLLYTELRDSRNLPGGCQTCENNSICWGCRALAYYEAGDILAADPKCWLTKN